MARLDPAAGGEAEGAAPAAGADPPVGTTASQAATTAPVAESPPGETDDAEESTVEEASPLEVKRSPDEGGEGSTDEAAPVADAAPPAGTAVFGGGSAAMTATERPEAPGRAETVTLVEWRALPETGTVSIGRSPSSAAGCSSGGGRSSWGMAMVLQRAASAPGARAPALQYWPT